jgi:hypothetical protein
MEKKKSKKQLKKFKGKKYDSKIIKILIKNTNY